LAKAKAKAAPDINPNLIEITERVVSLCLTELLLSIYVCMEYFHFFVMLIGHPPHSWIMRVQIALDAVRDLEYTHEHTKTHHVHRDIKTSNILLGASFRAKVVQKWILLHYFSFQMFHISWFLFVLNLFCLL